MSSFDRLQDLFALSDRVAVVTGATSGIGRAIALCLAEAGASVVAVARRERELATTVTAVHSLGGKAASVAADLGERAGLVEVASECRAAFGTVDIVVNAAGVNLREPAESITAESWDATIDLNLAVPFFLSREFIPGMRDRGYGRIINVASLQSTRAFPNGLAYGASKGGVCQLTRAMAEAWSRHGITCNAIAPGFFPTALTEPVFSNPQAERSVAEQTAIGRNGRLDDLAGAAIFFAAPASSYVTGQTLHVDGGFTAK